MTISETSTEILRRGYILTKTVILHKVSHTAKLCFSVVLKHFWGNSQKTFLFRHKSDYRRTSTEILRNLFFLPCLTRGQILRKIWICLNNYFWSNQLKGININNNSFSPKRGPYTAKLSLSLLLKHFLGNS